MNAQQGGDGTPSGDIRVEYASDANKADELVTALAHEHNDMVVLLKGSHVSGLSALAERWEQVQRDNASASQQDSGVLR
jgi:UDP-N-acetylmuramoyl-tripeptide--D-alanyl-D-alanine ligase